MQFLALIKLLCFLDIEYSFTLLHLYQLFQLIAYQWFIPLWFTFFPIAEAAEQLGKNVKLVERLVEWCEAKDHAGVMGESNRLLSALIRHSKSKVSSRGNRSLENIIWVAFLETQYCRSHIISLHFYVFIYKYVHQKFWKK